MRIVLLICCIFLFSCQQSQDPEAQLRYLNGYWEIDKVDFKDGGSKEFQLNTTIDYIEITNGKGIRKKLNPQLDGSYITANSVENLDVVIEEDSLRLYCSTPFSNWKETVIVAKDSSLSILASNGNVFHYRKFQQLNF